MLFGTCDGLNTGVVLYGHLVEDVKTVGGSMWVLTNYGLNIMSPTGSKVDYYEQFKGLRRIRCNPSGDGFLLHNGHLWFLNKKGRFQSVSLGSIRQNEVCDFSLSDGRLYVFLHDRIVRYVVRKTDSGYAVGRGETIASMTIKMATADDDVEYLVDQDNQLYAFRLATERLDRYLSLQHETDTHGRALSDYHLTMSLMSLTAATGRSLTWALRPAYSACRRTATAKSYGLVPTAWE